MLLLSRLCSLYRHCICENTLVVYSACNMRRFCVYVFIGRMHFQVDNIVPIYSLETAWHIYNPGIQQEQQQQQQQQQRQQQQNALGSNKY